MRFSSILAAAAATVLPAGASPTPRAVQIMAADVDYNWTVTSWEAGCARAGCFYLFNISAQAYNEYPQAPPFSAYCSGFGEGSPFAQCNLQDEGPAGRRVAARLQTKASNATGAHLAVSYQYNDLNQANTYWNWTAYTTTSYNQFVSPPLTFDVSPTEFWGVA